MVTPCVLPLVPGYLSAVSAVEADRLGERGAWRGASRREPAVRRSASRSSSSLLGAGAAAIGSVLDKRTQTEFAGFLLIVIGLGFVGLLPWPERTIAPGLLVRAARGSSVLLGGAFAVCAAPCIGTVLASILVLAGSAGSVVRGVVLLAAYSIGLGAAFVLAGVAFARAMVAFRWVRDHYRILQIVGGATLIALGPAALLRPLLVAAGRAQPGARVSRAGPDLARGCRSRPASRLPRPARGGRRRRAHGAPARTARAAALPSRAGARSRSVSSAPGLVPRDGDVDEPLEEVALRRLGRPPGVLELLVRLEVAAVPDQLEPAFGRRPPSSRRDYWNTPERC